MLAIRELDDGQKPIAEVCRGAGFVAAAIGLPRPSYVHVRRLVLANRARERLEVERRAAMRQIAADVAADVAAGRFVHPYDVADRIVEARKRARGSELQAPRERGEP